PAHDRPEIEAKAQVVLSSGHAVTPSRRRRSFPSRASTRLSSSRASSPLSLAIMAATFSIADMAVECVRFILRPISVYVARVSTLDKYIARCRAWRSEEHTSELQSRENLVCRLLLEK